MKNLFFLFLLLQSTFTFAQSLHLPSFEGQINESITLCMDTKKTADKQLQPLVDYIAHKVGLQTHITLAACEQTTHCQAYQDNGQSYIFYNPIFFQSLYGLDLVNDEIEYKHWQLIGLLAHEMAHLENDHLVKMIQHPDISFKYLDLWADEYVGVMMHLLEATLNQTQSFLDLLVIPEKYSLTIPNKKDRLASLKKGWEKVSIITSNERCYAIFMIPAMYKIVKDTTKVSRRVRANALCDWPPYPYSTILQTVKVREPYYTLTLKPAIFNIVTEEIPSKALPRVINKAIVEEPAEIIEKYIRAEYRTVSKQVLGHFVKKEVTAEYEYYIVNRPSLIKRGHEQMQEIPCE